MVQYNTHPDFRYLLGRLKIEGRAVEGAREDDFQKGLFLLNVAASSGHALAQLCLATA
jgi:hypothetical protein